MAREIEEKLEVFTLQKFILLHVLFLISVLFFIYFNTNEVLLKTREFHEKSCQILPMKRLNKTETEKKESTELSK